MYNVGVVLKKCLLTFPYIIHGTCGFDLKNSTAKNKRGILKMV